MMQLGMVTVIVGIKKYLRAGITVALRMEVTLEEGVGRLDGDCGGGEGVVESRDDVAVAGRFFVVYSYPFCSNYLQLNILQDC